MRESIKRRSNQRVDLLVGALLIFSSACRAAEAPPAIYQAVRDCSRLVETTRVLDVAESSMVLGADCSAGCCWPMAGKNELLGVSADGGTVLMSKDSKALVKYYSKGVTRVNTPHLIDELLLLVLFAVNPACFFFTYKTGSKLQALEQPTSASELSARVSGKQLPRGVTAPDLVLVWRRDGLLLMLSGAAHLLRDALGQPVETSSGQRWPRVAPATREAARALIAVRCSEQLLGLCSIEVASMRARLRYLTRQVAQSVSRTSQTRNSEIH